MTSNGASNSALRETQRKGSWSSEEEAYVDLLIEEFRSGALPIPEGSTLRSFLSKMINCNPKRISKKYENTNYNGKHKYVPSSQPMSLEERMLRRTRLQEHEHRFLAALKRTEDELLVDLEQSGEREQKARCNRDSDSAAMTTKSKTMASGTKDQTVEAILEKQKQQKQAATKEAKRSSFVNNGLGQDRLNSEIQSRMDLVQQMAGSSAGSASSTDMRDLSLTNTTPAQNSAFASVPITAQPQVSGCNSSDTNKRNAILQSAMAMPSPSTVAKPNFDAGCYSTGSVNQLPSLNLMSSLKQMNHFTNPPRAVGGGLSGHLSAELEDDPLGWHVRLQRKTPLTTNRSQSSFLSDRLVPSQGSIMFGDNKAGAPFPMPPYLRQSAQNLGQGDLSILKGVNHPLPSLSVQDPDQRRRSLLHPAGTMDHNLSQLQLASLVAREELRSRSGGAMTIDCNRVLEASRRSSILVSELEMMESLKRGREQQEALDSFTRPFKRR